MSSDSDLARNYIKARARKAADIMTAPVVTATETTPLRAIVELMERHRIKRVPIVRDDVAVGMVSRANLMQALATAGQFPASPKADRTIRDALQAELKAQRWAHAAVVNVIVTDGVIHLWGTVRSPEERTALRVAAENAGGKAVEDHLALVPALPAV
jgi:signal-transduction protein with cAMP-binding, CBS, and nucleotidyltransferase domain